MPIVTLNDRSYIAIDGEEAEHFLHNLLTTDIIGLPHGEMRAGALLSAQGKVMFAFLIMRTSSGFMFELDTRDASEFVRRVKFFRLRAKVNITDPIAGAVNIIWNEPKLDSSYVKDGRFSHLNVWRSGATLSNNTVQEAWTALRIENGVGEPHIDYTYGEVFPHDINLDQIGALSFSKGCYVGQEVVSRMHHRGTARWRLMVTRGEALEKGTEVHAGAKPAGTICSVSGEYALALVRLDRIKSAIDQNEEITAGSKPISLTFPNGVDYNWPRFEEDVAS